LLFVLHISIVGTHFKTRAHSVNSRQQTLTLLRFASPRTFCWWRHSDLRSAQPLGWTLLARIDGLTYSLLGAEVNVNGTANLKNIVVTPTRTLVIAQAAHMELNLTFLSPIEVRPYSSIPFNIYLLIL